MSLATVPQIGEVLQQSYGIAPTAVVSRAVGADAHAAVYRIDARNAQWWLKCRRYQVNPAVWDSLHWLRGTLGIEEIVAPWPTLAGAASAQRWGLQFTLFPYIEGQSGFEAPLSSAQWQQLGRVLRCLHQARLPEAMASALPQVALDTDALLTVGQWLQQPGALPTATDRWGEAFLALLQQQRARIAQLHARAEELQHGLQDQRAELRVCHTDLHAGNLLMDTAGRLHLIDWDGLALAPRERDLMFVGGAVGGRWGRERPQGFVEGYGEDLGDARWIAWYRHVRVLQDVIEFQQMLLGAQAQGRAVQQRRQALHFLGEQFAPGNVVDAAERAYRVACCVL